MRRKIFTRTMSCLVSVAMAFGLWGCNKHTHSYGEWETIRQASCTVKGRAERYCACGEMEYQLLDMLEHNYEGANAVVGSCTGGGQIKYTCSVCNNSYTEETEKKVYTATEIYEMYKDSVGEIVVYDARGNGLGLGSCFVYEEGDKVVTNYHVIEGAYSAEVTFGDKTYKVDQVLAYDAEIDVAVLRLNKGKLKPVVWCGLDHEVGTVVYALGNSKGLTSTFSDGIITTAKREVDGLEYIQHDAPISGGNSGGPLINDSGEVIGINTWTYIDSQNLNFAIPLTALDDLSYQSAMTMEEFYETECNVFEQLKNYIMEYGDYDSSDESYLLEMGERYSSDRSQYFSWWLSYYLEDGEINLVYSYDNSYMAMVCLNSDLDGVYDWYYMDDYDDTMVGTIYAATYTSMSDLSYDYTNVTDSELKTSVLGMASLLVGDLMRCMAEDLEDLGIDIADLGFLKL